MMIKAKTGVHIEITAKYGESRRVIEKQKHSLWLRPIERVRGDNRGNLLEYIRGSVEYSELKRHL